MAHLSGHDRSRLLLLPEAVDDYVGPDNPGPVHRGLRGRAGPCGGRLCPRGAEGDGPAGLRPRRSAEALYGYLNRVRSSRRLEAETHRNVEAIWLLRGLKPDFRTIADFRRDNRAAFRPVFRAFVVLCRQLDLFGRELLAVDGTRDPRRSTARTAASRGLR